MNSPLKQTSATTDAGLPAAPAAVPAAVPAAAAAPAAVPAAETPEPGKTAPKKQEIKRPEIKIPKARKKRIWLRLLIVLLILAAGFYFLVLPRLNAGPLSSADLYLPSLAARRDITVSIAGTATLQPADAYRVTTLVTGEILSAPFEEGDIVEEDALLFAFDPKDAQNSIQRAELSLEQSRLSYNDTLTSRKNARMEAKDGGVIQKLHVKEGDYVSNGTLIADILDQETMRLTVYFHAADAGSFYVGQDASVTVDGTLETLYGTVYEIAAVNSPGAGGTMLRAVTLEVKNPGALSVSHTGTAVVGGAACASGGTFAYAAQGSVTATTSGEIAELYVKEGDRVTKGQLLGAYVTNSIETQVKNAEMSVRNAELSLEQSRNALDNYTINSPISGTVIEKNFKAGDNVESGNSGYLAVIYDLSYLKLELSIDELDIGKIKVGQTASITADALEGQRFTGVVDRVNINGTTVGGVTTYPVTVIIDEPGGLLPGMNVTASILVENAPNVLSIPVDAVSRGNTVLVAGADAYDKNGVLDPSKLERAPVELGRSDSYFIEVLSGLNEGDTVVVMSQASSMMDRIMSGPGGGNTMVVTTGPGPGGGATAAAPAPGGAVRRGG